MKHDESCARSGKWYRAKECREFSTDGTALGATIAHHAGTMDEDEIQRQGEEHLREMATRGLTGMDAEQADWEEDE